MRVFPPCNGPERYKQKPVPCFRANNNTRVRKWQWRSVRIASKKHGKHIFHSDISATKRNFGFKHVPIYFENVLGSQAKIVLSYH